MLINQIFRFVDITSSHIKNLYETCNKIMLTTRLSDSGYLFRIIILVIAILIYINEESKNYFYFLKCTSNYFRVLKDFFFFSALYVGLRSNALQFSSLYSITVLMHGGTLHKTIWYTHCYITWYIHFGIYLTCIDMIYLMWFIRINLESSWTWIL